MRILVAVDEHPYSTQVLDEVAKLAANTWADVTLLGICSHVAGQKTGTDQGADSLSMARTLSAYRRHFLGCFKEGESPYAKTVDGYALVEVGKGVWEELYVRRTSPKELRVMMRSGPPVKQILKAAKECESDLIAIGCEPKSGSLWTGLGNIPERVVNEAPTSVLLVKDEKKPAMIVCCLDHHSVTQESIELTNQLVTLHQTELEIVGFIESEALKPEVENKMRHILEYYTTRGVKAWLKMVDVDSLESYINQSAKENLVALWMGKESLLEKMFPRKHLRNLVKKTSASLLTLR